MTADLDHLARANPIPVVDPHEPADELLRRVMMEAATRPGEVAAGRRVRARRRRSRAVVVFALALAAVGALVIAPGGSSDRVPRVVEHLAGAERAYAAVLPRGDVIHEVVASEWSVAGKAKGSERYEGWYRPRTGQAVRITGGDEGVTRVMITRDGTVLVDSADTARITGKTGLQPMTSPATNAFRARNRQDFAAAFRAAYVANELADRGVTTFDHHPAHRFALIDTRGAGVDALDFYADPRTGRPLGSVERIGDQVNVRRLTTWERLKPTPEALGRLDIGSATRARTSPPG